MANNKDPNQKQPGEKGAWGSIITTRSKTCHEKKPWSSCKPKSEQRANA